VRAPPPHEEPSRQREANDLHGSRGVPGEVRHVDDAEGDAGAVDVSAAAGVVGAQGDGEFHGRRRLVRHDRAGEAALAGAADVRAASCIVVVNRLDLVARPVVVAAAAAELESGKWS